MEVARVIGGVLAFFAILYLRWTYLRPGRVPVVVVRGRRVVKRPPAEGHREVSYRGGRTYWTISGLIAGFLFGILSAAILEIHGPTIVIVTVGMMAFLAWRFARMADHRPH